MNYLLFKLFVYSKIIQLRKKLSKDLIQKKFQETYKNKYLLVA